MSVWVEALRIGWFGLGDIKRIPFTLLAENVRVTLLEPLRTVCKMCSAIGKILSESYEERADINMDHLTAGALLADVGKMIEYEKRDDGSIVKGKKG